MEYYAKNLWLKIKYILALHEIALNIAYDMNSLFNWQ